MVQVIHDLDLVLHHLLPETDRQTDTMKGLKALSFLGETFLTHTRVPSGPAHQSMPVTSNDVRVIRFSYLFFKTPGFDDLCCQSEA